jgi:hypothetical protein
MSASQDQSCAEARNDAKHSTPPTGSRSLLKRAAHRGKSRRNMSLAAGVVVALLGIASLGQASGQSPDSTDLSRVSDTSGKSGQAPGHTKDSIVPATATPTPDPTTAAPASSPEPTTVAAPAPAPAPTTATATPTAETVAAPAPAPLATTSGSMPVGVPGAWTMKFDDEFSGTSLDTNKWSNCWFSPNCGTMNKVSTSPGNVAVSGGNLLLNLSSSTTGALVSTNPRGGATTGYQFTTGYVEARIKFPGDGTNLYNWPAFWTNGQTWPTNGENDIAEVLSGKMTVNYHSSSGSHNQGTVPGDWGNSFHTFGLHRMANSADVYFDGVKVKSYATDDGNAPQYLILNVGASGSTTSAYGAASQVQVDYVRAWQ